MSQRLQAMCTPPPSSFAPSRDKQASKLACAPGHSTTHWRQSHHLTNPTGPRSRACWSIVSQRSTGTTLLKTTCLAAGVRQSRLRLWAVLWLGGVKSLPFFLPYDFRGHGVFGGCQHWHWRFLDLEGTGVGSWLTCVNALAHWY